jgi:hypothetical protein
MGAAFAQAKPAATPAAAEKKNAIAMDVFPLLKGIIWSDSDDDRSDFALSFAYERLIAPHWSIGPNMEISFIDVDAEEIFIYFSLAAEGRYYPSANFDKFFLGATLGFNLLSYDGKTKRENGGFVGLITSLKMGYKVVTSNGFYMEPSLSYVLSKIDENPFFTFPIPSGWQGGLRLGFAF